MTTIRAIINETDSADRTVEQLSALNIADLEWEIFQPQVDHERIVPGVPAGTYLATGGTIMTPAAVPIVADLPEENVLEDAGVSDEEAEYYAESMEHGATVIVIDVPSVHADRVRQVLKEAGASRISD